MALVHLDHVFEPINPSVNQTFNPSVMAYTRQNLLQRMIDIQELYKQHSQRHRGSSTDKWIYENLVFPTYRISRATFYDYLATNAKKELNDLLDAKKKQLTLFG